ncbi:uncharacterized protein LOC113325341 [Papaver somniferum]|uniref:uncharacterized protein LOC113325341 n=1 Tax=Papaver somniferum TaxID=3469 RepID=UPI000E701C3B|nr:uncharacterized protein LOC113325341 [Papaver somniferum]
MENKVFWQISNGEKVHILKDPWLVQQLDHLISNRSPMPCEIDHVFDLIIPHSRSWNVPLLHELFPPDIVECITAIYLNSEVDMEDKLVWTGNASGKFSTKSCYMGLLNNRPSTSTMSAFPWKIFWSFSIILPKIHIFIWKIIHNGIAVKVNISRFIPNIDTTCRFCHQQKESTLHLLFLCPRSRMVLNDTTLNSSADVLEATFCETMIIRKARQNFNLCISEGETSRVNTGLSHRTGIWEPPENNYIKINIDAAFIPNNGAAGAVARDHNGMFLGCGTITFDATSSLLAESIACKLGMKLGQRFSFYRIIIEGDATNVTDTVLGDSRNIPWCINSVIHQIRDAGNSFVDVKFVYVPKALIIWLTLYANLQCTIM